VFDNLRYISGNVREQRRVLSRCVTTAVKDIHIQIQHQRNRTMTAEKNAPHNDRCTPTSHFRPDNTESPARKWYQSAMTLCGSSADTQTKACETAMVLKPLELDTTSVGGSQLQLRVRNHLVQPQNLHALEATLPQEWDNIPMLTISNCIHSMLRRCVAVPSANGGHTRY